MASLLALGLFFGHDLAPEFGDRHQLLGEPVREALLRAMTFMIVASPCAIVLATMPPLLSAVANAGRHGVLVRSAVAMEQLGVVVSHAERDIVESVSALLRRVNIPFNSTSPAGLIEANTVDPWNKSGKYALAYVYFCIPLLVIAALMRYYHLFTDKIRTALHQEEVLQSSTTSSPDTDYEMSVLDTDKSTMKFFPREGPLPSAPKQQSSVSSFGPINNIIAFFRFIFYRPIPQIRVKKGWRPIVFPSLAVIVIVLLALLLGVLYCTLPQPLFWDSIAYGSPPLAVRSGMMAVALMPWIVALATKANLISMVTGISHERLNVFHRWAAYICLVLSILHTVPFYVTPVWEKGAHQAFQQLLNQQSGMYIYGTGMTFPSKTQITY